MAIKIIARLLGHIISLCFRALYLCSASYNPLKVSILGVIVICGKSSLKIGGMMRTRGGFFMTIDDGTVKLGRNVTFNRGASINCMKSIIFGDNVMVGQNVHFYDHDHVVEDFKPLPNRFNRSPIVIGSNVWIGSNCTILKGVNIGDNVVVACSSIVTKDIPPNSVFIQKRIAI